jgi:hypothetical protein
MNKCCTKCSIEKPLTEFSKTKNVRMKDGYQWWCKSCLKVYYLNNKEKWKARDKYNEQWKLNNPEKTKKHVKTWKYKISGIYEWYENDICLYVGQSIQLNGRIQEHKSLFKNSELSVKYIQAYLYEALRQHQNPQIRIIEECLPEVLLEREQYYIDTKKPLYNTYSI